MRLFHIVPAADWQRALATGTYAPPSLISEGFIHLSTAGQVGPTRARFFAGVDGLCLLELDGDALGPGLRWVDVVHADDGSVGRFPHLHRSLSVDEARRVPFPTAP